MLLVVVSLLVAEVVGSTLAVEAAEAVVVLLVIIVGLVVLMVLLMDLQVLKPDLQTPVVEDRVLVEQLVLQLLLVVLVDLVSVWFAMPIILL
tara:strand:- start:40 stop:315 length:276 start_codon:yes stop_codon:yes gene_type:complete